MKHAGVEGGVCERREVFRFALASKSLTILSARWSLNNNKMRKWRAVTSLHAEPTSPNCLFRRQSRGWYTGYEKRPWRVECAVCLVKHLYTSTVKLKYDKVTLFHTLTKMSIYFIFKAEN